MELGQLQAVVEIAHTQNLSRASEALFVTQPAISARLRSLERELGAELFVRSRRGMRLTQAGRAFLPYATRVLETLEESRRAVSEVARGSGGELTIGAAPAVGTYVL